MPSSLARTAWITGAGIVSPIGIGLEPFWKASLAGETGTRRLEYPWLQGRNFRTRIGAPVTGLDMGRWSYSDRDLRLLDPVCRFALAATAMALQSAGLGTREMEDGSGRLSLEGCDPERAAVVIGSSMGGLGALEASHSYYLSTGGNESAKWLRYGLPTCIVNAPSAQIARRHGLFGECKTISTACASGTMAIGDACRLIWTGAADVVIAGGTEALLSDHDGLGLFGFDVLRCMSTFDGDPARASRPFHARRDGFVLGEGAGIVVVESAAHAAARGVRPLAEIAAYETACDAWSMLQPEPSGRQIERMVRRALESAGLVAQDVDYVNAHGTGTPAGDRIESAALRRALGSAVDDVRVSSTKSMTGHAISASGAFEAITCSLALRDSALPPTANLDEVDPECDLHHVRGAAERRPVRVTLSTSYAFGGHDAVLVFRAA